MIVFIFIVKEAFRHNFYQYFKQNYNKEVVEKVGNSLCNSCEISDVIADNHLRKENLYTQLVSLGVFLVHYAFL